MLSKDCKVLQSFIKKVKVCKCCRAGKYGRIVTNVVEFAVLSNVAGSLILCRCCNRFQKKDRNKKKCNVAEPTVMAELSKCCGASNVTNITVLSNIAKCCRIL